MLRHSSATYCWAQKMNRYQLCAEYGWAFSSDMPDRYIERKGIIFDQIAEKGDVDQATVLSKIEMLPQRRQGRGELLFLFGGERPPNKKSSFVTNRKIPLRSLRLYGEPGSETSTQQAIISMKSIKLQKENGSLMEKVERLEQEYNKLRMASEFIMSVVECMDPEDLKQRVFEKREKELSMSSDLSPC